MRYELISAAEHKDTADRLFESLCIIDGVMPAFANVYYLGLKVAGEPHTKPESKKEIHEAP
ncbi:MAG: hypothetical protein QNK26_03170 [Moritella sp.]|uniref:hypothetical protein n=1 Tax=Moritella sp. TaxID=78556 RepID=UPI0029AEF2E7|nr:hypothetical protein [Moritella sp.]MDX2319580.1 hypothetical protein [Moritella sp.]